MTKHVIDLPKTRTDAMRLRQYLNIQRSQHPDRASLMLQRRMRKGRGTALAREFLRIDRGQYA